eukprot:1529704-Prymnesium_polylepis.1
MGHRPSCVPVVLRYYDIRLPCNRPAFIHRCDGRLLLGKESHTSSHLATLDARHRPAARARGSPVRAYEAPAPWAGGQDCRQRLGADRQHAD